MKAVILRKCMKGIIKMKKLINNIEFELKYFKFKKIYIFIALFLIAVNVLTMYMDMQYVSSSYDEYRYAQDYYKENPNEINEEEDYKLTENEDGSTTVSNPLQFHYDQVSKSLFVVSPKYCVSQILEMSFFLLPLLFCILGVFMANYDKHNGVFKHRILRFGKENYYLAKLWVGVGLIVIGVLFTAFVGKIANIPFYRYICNSYPVEEFELGNAYMLSSDFVKILLIMLICLLFFSLSFFLSLLTNNSAISLIIVVLYNYIAPCKVAYGIKNCYRALLKEKFDFYGVISVSGIKQVNIVGAVLVLVSVIVFSQVASYLIIKKRSAYV